MRCTIAQNSSEGREVSRSEEKAGSELMGEVWKMLNIKHSFCLGEDRWSPGRAVPPVGTGFQAHWKTSRSTTPAAGGLLVGRSQIVPYFPIAIIFLTIIRLQEFLFLMAQIARLVFGVVTPGDLSRFCNGGLDFLQKADASGTL